MVEFDRGNVVGRECEAPCDVLETVLLDDEPVNVGPVPTLLASTVEFRDMKGKVLSLHELDALGAWVLVKRVLLVLIKGAVEDGEAGDVLAPVVRFEASDVNVSVDVYDSVLVLVALGSDEDSLVTKSPEKLDDL
ncbi:hypothetical protein N0V93_009541 [Gnomoniopsis smithogilvyi]|uniref:Uncharacterized protein n=1 Tax=Gnomoniopsis smithogilvyi TaxID=1191159 RepID=A0A9W8YM83_9PEZI|nr:hypothetical protein N0V93_009541 [Gnomoniopsis smithogilvyi]